MIFKKITGLGILLLFTISCKAQEIKNPESEFLKNNAGKTLAFPGAEGFGKFTSGGRGGKVGSNQS